MSTTSSPSTPQIEFVTPLLGLSEHTRFELAPLDPDGIFFTLRSTQDPDLRLVLTDPMLFYPDYDAVIDGETARSLEIESDDDGALLAVVNMSRGPEQATINLFAPIVVNPKAHRAAQATLYGEDHPLDAPLTPRT